MISKKRNEAEYVKPRRVYMFKVILNRKTKVDRGFVSVTGPVFSHPKQSQKSSVLELEEILPKQSQRSRSVL